MKDPDSAGWYRCCTSMCLSGDGDFEEERTLLPLHRAAMVVRYPNTGRQQVGQHWEDKE